MRRLSGILLLVVVAIAPGVAAGNGAKPRPLVIVQVTYDNSKGFPIEGSRSYLRLRKRGRLVARHRGNRLNRRVAPGLYRLRSFQRICDGNCLLPNLDPPSHACARRFRVKRGQTARIRVVVPWHKKHCRMGVRIEG